MSIGCRGRNRPARNSPSALRTATFHCCSHTRAPLSPALPSRHAHAHGRLPPPCAQATVPSATSTTAVIVLLGTVVRLVFASQDGMLVGVAVVSVSPRPDPAVAHRALRLDALVRVRVAARPLLAAPRMRRRSLTRAARAVRALRVARRLSCPAAGTAPLTAALLAAAAFCGSSRVLDGAYGFCNGRVI